MKYIADYYSLYLSWWHGLLAAACMIIIYLVGAHISEAIQISTFFTFFNTDQALISWEPSRGNVDHYLIEITDTHLLGKYYSFQRNCITTTRYATSRVPRYRLACAHNHSYQVRVKAIASTGVSSDYSEPSILFICDQEPPELTIDPLPSIGKKVRSQRVTMTGIFYEPHLSLISINDVPATINHQENTFRASLALQPGENAVDFYARDLAGNISNQHLTLTCAPIEIVSWPANATLYWNGNYAYAGNYGGTTPCSFIHAGQPKQSFRISLTGYQDYFGIIDFSDLSQDVYVFSLVPHQPTIFTQITPVLSPDEGVLRYANNLHPFVVDYNLDGAKDLLAGIADGTIILFLNRGSNYHPLLSEKPITLYAENIPIDVGTNAAPFIVDFNNDGSFDLLIGNGDGLVYYFKNKGSNTEPDFSSPVALTYYDGMPISVESNCMPWVTDWNGDGKKDLLLGNGGGTPMLAINEGSDCRPLFTFLSPIDSEGSLINIHGPSAPCVFDWNQDGLTDVLLGTGDGSVHVYYRGGEKTEPTFLAYERITLNGQPLVLNYAASPFPVDWNEDGKTELLLGNSDGGINLLN